MPLILAICEAKAGRTQSSSQSRLHGAFEASPGLYSETLTSTKPKQPEKGSSAIGGNSYAQRTLEEPC